PFSFERSRPWSRYCFDFETRFSYLRKQLMLWKDSLWYALCPLFLGCSSPSNLINDYTTDGDRGGIYGTKNYIVNAPSRRHAEQIAEEAEALRQEIAIEWLGHHIDDEGEARRTIIFITFDPDQFIGRTRISKNPKEYAHSITLYGSQREVVDHLLKH